MIEKIQISDPSIAEEIRKNMAVATSINKGLTPSQQALTEYVIEPNESISINLDYGIYLLVSKTLDGSSVLFQVTYRASSFRIISDPSETIGKNFNVTPSGDGTKAITINNIKNVRQVLLLNRI